MSRRVRPAVLKASPWSCLLPSLGERPLPGVRAAAAPAGLALLMAAAALWAAGHLLAGPAALTAVPAPAPPAAPASPPAEPSIAERSTRLAALHLFGEPSAQPPADPPSTTQQRLARTRLALDLHGVWFGTGGGTAFAVISETRGPHRRYAPHDELPGGARLERIEAQSVVLRHNGRLERLPLREPALAAPAAQGATPATAPQGRHHDAAPLAARRGPHAAGGEHD